MVFPEDCSTKVCQEYLPLAGETKERYCRSLDRWIFVIDKINHRHHRIYHKKEKICCRRRKRLARHGSHTQSWPAGSRPRPLGEVKIIIHKMVVAVVLVIKMVVIMVTLGENINIMPLAIWSQISCSFSQNNFNFVSGASCCCARRSRNRPHSLVARVSFCQKKASGWKLTLKMQGAADAREYWGLARLPQESDAAQDGGGGRGCFPHEGS